LARVLFAVDWLESVPRIAEREIARVRDAGHEVIVHPTERALDEHELSPLLPGIAGCISGAHRFSARSLEHADVLKSISRHGAGYETIDLAECTRRGIVVTNGFGAGAPAVAEFTITLLLGLARRLCFVDRRLREGDWLFRSSMAAPSVIGRTLGLIGFGHIGREAARRARGCDMRITYSDVADPPEADRDGTERRELDDLLGEADFVSLHVALNDATYHMIGARELELMKPGGFLVNTSRGGVIDEDALYQALKARRIAGAALDVFEEEPVRAPHPLFEFDDERVIVSPHLAGINDDAKDAMLRLATDNLLDVLAGRRPPLVTNPDVYGAAAV